MKPIEKIQFFFRNFIAEHVILSGEYNAKNLRSKLLTAIHECINTVLRASEHSDGIVLNDLTVDVQNCPQEYQELFQALLALKESQQSDEQVGFLAQQVLNSDIFASLNLPQYLLGDQPKQQNMPLTVEEIRQSFYDAMTAVAFDTLDNKLFTVDDYYEENPKLYEALPALTLLAAIENSRDSGNNIRLLSSKLFNQETCPNHDTFKALLSGTLKMKSVIEKLTEEQKEVMKFKLSSDKELPEKYKAISTPVLMQTLSALASKATDIAREPVFKKMVGDIFELIVPRDNPAQRPN